ncbi:MAG: twitching motility protein PilT [Candidatus Cloacimonadota bacterium]|nr:MAG: twitching motility protein PilT [Candidatus Cloacimonadota bacterium]
MSLSFQNEFSKLPPLTRGTERINLISEMLNEHPEWRAEAEKKMNNILAGMISKNASDLDFGGFGSKNMVWMRVHGNKYPVPDMGRFRYDEMSAFILSVLTVRQLDQLMISQNTDFAYQLTHEGQLYRFRADAYMDFDQLAINFRFINPVAFHYRELGFPNKIIEKFDLAFEKKGLILVTGLTGCGKSTTLDSIISMNNHKNSGHIVIIGNPVEHVHQSDKCIIRHREVGRDTISFKEGSIEALRQDPDIIVIGEMRDPETMMTALEITDSGHKVFSTLHTASAVESIHRIVAEVPVNEQARVRNRLADVLSVVVSQKLVPALNGKRVLAKEILNVTSYVAAAINNDNISEIYQMISEGKESGMISLEQDLFRLFMNKVISKETAISYANNKKRLFDLLNYYRHKM